MSDIVNKYGEEHFRVEDMEAVSATATSIFGVLMTIEACVKQNKPLDLDLVAQAMEWANRIADYADDVLTHGGEKA